MKVATFIEPGKMTVTEAPVPEIQKDTDVIIKESSKMKLAT